MTNFIALTGRVPAFEGKFTPANGDKKARMNWAINVTLDTKNEQGYYDEVLMNFVVWGYDAEYLQTINQLPKDDEHRKGLYLSITGKYLGGYKNQQGEIVTSPSIKVMSVDVIQKRPKTNNTQAPATGHTTATMPAANRPAPMGGRPVPPTGRPGGAGMPPIGRTPGF